MKFWHVIPATFLALLPLIVNAETTNSAPVTASTLLQTIFGLIVVLAVIVFLGWLLKRSQYFHAGHQGHLKVVSAISLGTREKAVLIQVGEQQILLGVTPQQINTLHLLSEPLPTKQSNSSNKENAFAERLKQMMQQRGNS